LRRRLTGLRVSCGLVFAAVAAGALVLLLAALYVADILGVRLARTLPPEAISLFRATTDIGREYWLLYPAAILFVYLAFLIRYGDWPPRRKAMLQELTSAAGYLFVSITSASLAVRLVKLAAGRARPSTFETLGPLAFDPFSGASSFPSGHAATAAAAALALGFLFPRLRVVLIALAAWVCLSRVALGAHYVTDVLAGAAAGAASAIAWRRWFAARSMLWRRPSRVALRRRRLLCGFGRNLRQALVREIKPG
jgi:undecaprenyl-diphosphatase